MYQFVLLETGEKKMELAPKYAIKMKILKFLSYQADILLILNTHELDILTKFGNDWTKIVDFLLIAYYSASSIFFSPVCRCTYFLFAYFKTHDPCSQKSW